MSFITQKGATGVLALQSGGSFQSSTDTNLATLVGSRWDLSDGREVILVSSGTSTAIGSAGVLCQDAPITTAFQSMAVTAVQAYANNGNTPATVTTTLGAAALAVNQYQGGFLSVTGGGGNGQTLRITSHLASAGSTSVTIVLEDAPNTALNTTSVVDLIPPHGSQVVISPTTPTNVPVGVTLYPLAVSSFGFLTSKGLTSCFSDNTAPAIGSSVMPSITTAGRIASAGGTLAIIGYAATAATSGDSNAIFVNL